MARQVFRHRPLFNDQHYGDQHYGDQHYGDQHHGDQTNLSASVTSILAMRPSQIFWAAFQTFVLAVPIWYVVRLILLRRGVLRIMSLCPCDAPALTSIHDALAIVTLVTGLRG